MHRGTPFVLGRRKGGGPSGRERSCPIAGIRAGLGRPHGPGTVPEGATHGERREIQEPRRDRCPSHTRLRRHIATRLNSGEATSDATGCSPTAPGRGARAPARGGENHPPLPHPTAPTTPGRGERPPTVGPQALNRGGRGGPPPPPHNASHEVSVRSHDLLFFPIDRGPPPAM